MIEEAKKYIEMGWSVLPCFGYNKNPAPINWKRYQNKRATIEEWQEWEKEGPTGICVITGEISGIVVIDVDDPKLQDKYESTVVSQTRGGGFHFFYKYTEKIKNTVKIDGTPVDFRGDGGLVLIPPSQAKGKDGEIRSVGEYKWMLPPDRENMKSLPELPKPKKLEAPRPQEKLVVESAIGLVEGERNDTLYKYACSLIRKHGEGIAKEMIEFMNAKAEPPLPQREIDTLFKSANDFITAHPEVNGIISPYTTETEDNLAIAEYDNMTDSEILTMVRPQLAKLGISKLDILFDWPAGFYLICGISNVGKGFFASWVGRRLYEQCGLKSVLFSLEMPENLVRDRCLQSWSDKTKVEYLETGATKEAIKKLKDSFRVIEFNLHDIKKQTPTQFKKEFERFYKQGYRCFTFDHLLELSGATDNASAQKVSQEWGKTFQEISKYHKDCWLFVYTQKRIEKNNNRDSKNLVYMSDIQGAKSPIQKSDVFIGISRGKEDGIDTRDFYVHIEKNRFGESKFFVKLYFAPDGNFYDSEVVYNFLHKTPSTGTSILEAAETLFDLETE
jgi:hypothetical protein